MTPALKGGTAKNFSMEKVRFIVTSGWGAGSKKVEAAAAAGTAKTLRRDIYSQYQRLPATLPHVSLEGLHRVCSAKSCSGSDISHLEHKIQFSQHLHDKAMLTPAPQSAELKRAAHLVDMAIDLDFQPAEALKYEIFQERRWSIFGKLTALLPLYCILTSAWPILYLFGLTHLKKILFSPFIETSLGHSAQWHRARRITERLRTEQSVVFSTTVGQHVTYMQIDRQADSRSNPRYTVSLYNAAPSSSFLNVTNGLFRNRLNLRRSRADVLPQKVSTESLARIIEEGEDLQRRATAKARESSGATEDSSKNHVQEISQMVGRWLSQFSGRRISNGQLQKPQSAPNCTYHCNWALLRNQLSDSTRLLVRATFLDRLARMALQVSTCKNQPEDLKRLHEKSRRAYDRL
jgi:hypothetical protein